MSDNEHATAALWNSEILSVQDSVGPPIPEFAQRPEEGAKVPSSTRRQDSGDIFPDQPTGACRVSKSKKFECQVATRVSQSLSESGDGEGLTWCSSDKNVNCSGFDVFMDFREVSEIRRVREPMSQHGRRERVDLREPCRLPPERLPGHGCRFYTGTHGTVDHANSPASLFSQAGNSIALSAWYSASVRASRAPSPCRTIEPIISRFISS